MSEENKNMNPAEEELNQKLDELIENGGADLENVLNDIDGNNMSSLFKVLGALGVSAGTILAGYVGYLWKTGKLSGYLKSRKERRENAKKERDDIKAAKEKFKEKKKLIHEKYHPKKEKKAKKLAEQKEDNKSGEETSEETK